MELRLLQPLTIISYVKNANHNHATLVVKFKLKILGRPSYQRLIFSILT